MITKNKAMRITVGNLLYQLIHTDKYNIGLFFVEHKNILFCTLPVNPTDFKSCVSSKTRRENRILKLYASDILSSEVSVFGTCVTNLDILFISVFVIYGRYLQTFRWKSAFRISQFYKEFYF